MPSCIVHCRSSVKVRAYIELRMAYLAWCSLGLAFLSAIVIVVDEVRHPQEMTIMNLVWPITAVYLSVFVLWAYFAKGRPMTSEAAMQKMSDDCDSSEKPSLEGPTLAQTALAASHAVRDAYSRIS